MERLVQQNKNTGSEYNKIYFERAQRKVDSQDLKRWKALLKYYKGGKILDMGCLDSRIISLVADPDKYIGIDIAEKAIEDMQRRFQGIFVSMDLYKTIFPDKVFDYIVLGEVVEHLEKPEEAVKEAMRILKSKGTLAISTPLEESKEPGAVDGERHLWSFNIGDLLKLLKPYGRVRTAILGSEYFPIYKYHWPTLLSYCKKK